ncbi:MAG: hypothetical protein GY754_23785 [bacterium]|nr:hypothetical protein [bacterium]
MFKKILLAVCILLFIASCASRYGKITVRNDDFKELTTVTLVQNLSAEESGIRGGKPASFTFVKEIKDKRIRSVKLFIQITVQQGDPDLTKDVFVELNGDKKQLSWFNNSGKIARTYIFNDNIPGHENYSFEPFEEENQYGKVSVHMARYVDYTKKSSNSNSFGRSAFTDYTKDSSGTSGFTDFTKKSKSGSFDSDSSKSTHSTSTVYYIPQKSISGVLLLDNDLYNKLRTVKRLKVRVYYGPNPLTYVFNGKYANKIREFKMTNRKPEQRR